MKNRIKYLLIIFVLLFLVFGIVNAFLEARDKKLEEIEREKNKIAEKNKYKIKRNVNKYTISGTEIGDNNFSNIYYDSYNVYLYYDKEDTATLLKYNVEDSKIVVLFENDPSIHGGFARIGKYYKLGNSIYNKKFEKVMDYPNLNDNELLFPNLKEKLIKKDSTIYIENIETNELKEIIKDTDEISYNPYSIKNDGKYFLLKKRNNDKEYIVTYNKKGEILNTISINEENSKYKLLDDVPYLLKEINSDKVSYKLYNANNNDLVYTSSDVLDNYIFDNTKFVANDVDENIRLIDFVTGEDKKLISSKDKANHFILASDMYSLLLTIDKKDNVFYIFYL